ncbi:hypothetical protein [uncultured Salinicola sp.]|uniref:hypothetical protein n=1 Tax=uncultured Salinicola sp. TaxID=1193542 RepID=UPI0026215BF4|nr:hypothetical protein [uncultured Salinicola sp.]
MKKVALFVAALVSFPAALMAQGMFGPGSPPPGVDQKDAEFCLPSQAADEAEIVTLAVEEPNRIPLMMQFGPRPDGPASLVTVRGGSGTPIVLHLISKGSVVWDLREVSSSRIKGVLLYTSERNVYSGVAGLSDDVPIEYGAGITGRYHAYEIECLKVPALADLNSLPTLTKAMNVRFGKSPARMYATPDGDAFDLDEGIIDPIEVEAPVPEAVRSIFPVKTLDILPGEAGIHQLVMQGSLKPFTRQDAQSWAAAGGSLSSAFSIDERILMQIPSGAPEQMREQMRDRIASQDKNIQVYSGYFASSKFTLPTGFRPSPNNAIVLAPDAEITLTDDRLGMLPAIYRLSGLDPENIQTSGSAPDQPDRREAFSGYEEEEPRHAFEATWSGDKVEISFPKMEVSASPAHGEEETSWAWLLAVALGVLALVLGGLVFYFVRRR